ncbi:unnamed protein product [Prunus brigantina]
MRNCSSSNSQSDNSKPTTYGEWMKTRAIRDSRVPINTQAPRGVRRKARQIGGVNPGVLVECVSQSEDGSNGIPYSVVRAGHDRVILVEENCPSHWPWPIGRVRPISFEERLKWAKTQIAFGKHYVTDWAATGPLERRQNEKNMGLTNEISIEPVFNSPFDTIHASAYQTHHREVDEAFVRMCLKRDADPRWQKNKNEVKRARPQSVRQVSRKIHEGKHRLHRNLSSPKKPKSAVESRRLSIDDFSEESLIDIHVGVAVEIGEGRSLQWENENIESMVGGGGWPETAARMP